MRSSVEISKEQILRTVLMCFVVVSLLPDR